MHSNFFPVSGGALQRPVEWVADQPRRGTWASLHTSRMEVSAGGRAPIATQQAWASDPPVGHDPI